ncbi:ABC transporter ATP-binding protein [Actinomyces sp. MRS3W]|uniref:ABC transporter ATP-binding protein n=1 Tax=Actinomyces sp. MRS3W TaxID=2800796 RepID=UPI0028FD27FD|nr:ABC transporter ATP-binding protein [Actinomyces sp. MRS3W]MDU0348391.1 ABC transporter ATP-binding protein [Actinomyces sp. MRS3W]
MSSTQLEDPGRADPHNGSRVPARTDAGTGDTDRAIPRNLTTRDLHSGYGRRTVVDGVDITIPTGAITVIVGANACGKSTLLKTMARILTPSSGSVLLDGRDVSAVPTRRLATRLGLLPQQPIAPEGIVVSDLVGRARHPHQGLFRSTSATDRRIVEEALIATRTDRLADRSVDELSGGQRQRVWIAMALAQRTDVLLLDEPTTFLDLAHQVEVLDLLTDLNHERGTTVVMVLHDINLAARYADHIIAMREGRVVAAGEPTAVVSPELMREVFNLEAEVITDPVSATPLVLPRGRHHITATATNGAPQ